LNKSAQCCCGDLKIEVTGKPERHGMCHCNDCKRRTGSAFGLSAYFKNENVIILFGESVCYQVHNQNKDAVQERFFCKKCGTTLYWNVSCYPQLTGVAGGCFAEDALDRPSYSASHGSKYDWVKVPIGVREHQ